MSKRGRHAQKQSDFSRIEWLQHRTGYPSPEERERIIQLRQELTRELLLSMAMGVKPDNRNIQALVKKYTAGEVERGTRTLSENLKYPSLVADDASSYRDYRLRYARFGAGLQFYTNRELDDLYGEHIKSIKNVEDLQSSSEIGKRLLFGWRDWEDITPPAIPLRPDDFNAPAPGSYPEPINELLEWGDNLYRSHRFSDEVDFLHWRKHIPALTRMALDPGLLNGWPSEKASWAPWHAIHALGALEAWESAPALAELANLENDWLSDHLPHVWAEMGMEVEPSLWMILEDNVRSAKQRGLAAQGLRMMAEDNDMMENKVARGFVRLLENTETFDPTVNAYLIHFLREMDEVEEVWEAIKSAFDEKRVDLKVITPEDFEEYGYFDEFPDDEEFEDEVEDE